MAAITASMVGELRAKTDAPMMECKKALTEANGDFEKAEELLRVKLGNKAGKAAARITAEGVVTASIAGTTGALLEVNCETDFVTKNDSFLALAKAAADLVAKSNPADVAALGALPYSQDGFGPTLEDVRKGLIGKLGENMSFRRFKRFAGSNRLAASQPFVKNDKQTVEQMLKAAGTTVKGFTLFVVGEGIEKKQDDFAAEVAAQVAAAKSA